MSESGSFTELNLPRVIDTSTTDFIDEFYDPLLSRSIRYRRGVGYFTSNWVRSAARGIAELAENDGTVEWIVSPKLQKEDWEAFKSGDKAKREHLFEESLDKTISNLRYELEYDTRNAVAWMIADGLLEIKLAVPSNKLSGDFHDKFGVMYDKNKNRVAFHGSQNDSQQSLQNYEAYTIDCDWISDREQAGVDQQEQRFERLWNGKDENIEIYSIPESIANDIAELRDTENRPYSPPQSAPDQDMNIQLREYQQDAVDAWFVNDCQGLFQMATGTGKTFTALAALIEYIDTVESPLLCIIAVPQNHLARQWDEEMEIFGLDSPKYIYGSENRDWKQDLSRIVSDIKLEITEYECLITTHKTLSSEAFRKKIDGLTEDVILIADEVHGLGSEHQQQGLLESYNARIGLSATPERHYDEEGTNFLIDYFGGVTFEYTLEEAIPEYLTPYEYHPIIVEMDEDELEEYRTMTGKVAAAHGDDEVSDEVEQILQSQRASIVKSAIRKYDALRNILDSMTDVRNLLVYTNPDQIDTVGEILNEYGVIHHKFTYEEDNDLRDELLERFGKGEWQALVAMKCLDEGVDVPETRTAILMSNSGNPMQFVQRRGRVLRQAEGKDHATIYDLLVVPTKNPDEEIKKSEKNILKKEIRRFEEFASTANNEHSARNKLEDLRISYGI
ncbi:DEAD/DEAH box helicase family protein [Haloarcula sp. H-GB4]|uniref:DEAD/DEAH box helicase family protein n=1 Tax=Haloarcula sp. H-GB4 TaxID=3069755 RepID=UPI0027B58473|nr:DEAD/DEAH box helicase family protein [Haloarcula sp. H-GB4]MDQ2074841.1 DEAD/DEAH box helicase family protein [Haloarcula sp. H-GB4]